MAMYSGYKLRRYQCMQNSTTSSNRSQSNNRNGYEIPTDVKAATRFQTCLSPHFRTTLFAAVNCGNPGTPSNGRRTGSSTTYNSVVRYTCNTGYTWQGSNRRTCQFNGQWSGSLLRCNRKFFVPLVWTVWSGYIGGFDMILVFSLASKIQGVPSDSVTCGYFITMYVLEGYWKRFRILLIFQLVLHWDQCL